MQRPVPACLAALAALVVLTEQKAAAAEPPYRPVVAMRVAGDLPDEMEAKLAEAVSASMQKATLEAMARAVYGTAPGFAWTARRPQAGPLTELRYVLVGLDQALDRELTAALRQDLAQLGDRQGKLIVRGFFESSATPLPPGLGARLRQGPFAMAWGMLQTYLASRPAGDQAAAMAPLLTALTDLAVVDSNHLPDGVQLGYHARPAYEWLAKTFPDSWCLYELSLEMYASSRGIDARVRVELKPAQGGFYSELVDADPSGPVLPRYVKYAPRTFAPLTPSMVRFELTRTYAGATRTRPEAAVKFGHFGSAEFTQCRKDGCVPEVFALPTIAVKARLPQNAVSWWQAVVNGVGSGVNVVVPGLGTLTSAAFSAGVDVLRGGIEQAQDIFLLLQTLAIDMTPPPQADADGRSVAVPFKLKDEGATLPIVVRLNTPLGGREHVVIDEDTKVLGYQLYTRYAKSEIVGQINNDVVRSAQALDAQAAEALRNAAGAVTDLFR